MRIYLAGPFFSDEQIDRIARAEQALTQNQTVDSFFSPRLSDENSIPLLKEGTPEWAQMIFKKDVEEIDDADLVVAVADFVHANVDSGTAFEVGYAYHSNKPIVIVQELDESLNLMLGQALTHYTTSVADLATLDFTNLPNHPYSGQTF
ncbi:nucleoside 2-deoxyribosyltransferase [Limosilactobacillus fermentum]|uniref:nucleoside 2-deoxyribosyltransferase n=1 Tax=Limosilactobacillus fermentum TaxID=1613 RepID=UPI0021A72160|nr:nucleoside 2-deoxyribosyltransferase [Limosilactobacillus fermentum]MCT2870683.1 nucleoside 2-deoxyribosyltransferase [Limosilactobacillus fermentum]MCT2918859.1 nucleoside 2-deoxyribosyltransferase [Limosilactobacillus fermentum]